MLHVSWVRSYDLGSLYREAELVVKGVITGKKKELVEGGLPFTLHTVRVEGVIKGTPPGDRTITVLQTGGQRDDGTKFEVASDPLVEQGDTLILFLKPYQGGFADKLEERVFVPLGGPQGRFHLRNGRVYSVGELHSRAETVTRHLKTNGIGEKQFLAKFKSE